MSVLSDNLIRERVEEHELLSPMPQEDQYGPCSVDLRLGCVFYVPDPRRIDQPVDMGDSRDLLWAGLEYLMGPSLFEEEFTLLPGMVALGRTVETITMPADLMGMVDGRSILGRYGLAVHLTAQHIHPGWSGKLVLEFHNVGNNHLLLRAGMRICTIFFHAVDGMPSRLHGGG